VEGEWGLEEGATFVAPRYQHLTSEYPEEMRAEKVEKKEGRKKL